MRLHLDFETFCEYPIAWGMYGYTAHPSLDVLCMCYAFGDEPVGLWYPPMPVPPRVTAHIKARGIVAAHNAGFEYLVWNRFFAAKDLLKPVIRVDQLVCTAAKAAALSLPRALDNCAIALGLDARKDAVGKRIMMRLAKLCKPSKKHPSTRWAKEDALEDYAKLYDYCRQDVVVEREVDKSLPDLSLRELKLWQQDLRINNRGIQVDLAKVRTAINTWDKYRTGIIAECKEITGVEPSKVQALRIWIKNNSPLHLENLQVATIDKALERTDLPENLVKVLQARRYSSATSISKFVAMLRSADQNRLRGMFLYCGAGTGRWAGKIVQLHNLPRGEIKDIANAIELMEIIPYVFERPAKALSACVRGMLIAKEGYELAVADYSGIEARVVQWLAGDEEALQVFINGLDPYKVMAVDIYGGRYEDVTKSQRAIGKQAILGLGYGMGWEVFTNTCAGYGITIDKAFAKEVVSIYRKKHIILKNFWKAMEKAAHKATRIKGKLYPVGKVSFISDDRFLFMILPSGRRIAYYRARVADRKALWGDIIPTLVFMGTHSQTHQFVEKHTYGAKLVENCLNRCTLIITSIGVIHLYELKPEHKVWDGVEFVAHGGLIDQGERETIEWNGIQGTKDHQFWAEGWYWCQMKNISKPEVSVRPRGDVVSWSHWHTKANRGYLNNPLKSNAVYDIRNCGPRNSFVVLGTHGPVLAHNCTQAVARDMLATALMKYDDVVAHVHDEIVREVPIGSVDIHQFEKEICQFGSWADGCPISAEGFITARYKK